MATLAEIIQRGGESARNQLRQGRQDMADREGKELAKDLARESLLSSQQRREESAATTKEALASSQQSRSQSASTTAESLATSKQKREQSEEVFPIQKRAQEAQTYGFELKNQREVREAATEMFDPLIDTALSFYDTFNKTGDYKILSKAKSLISKISSDDKMWSLGGASVPYGTFATFPNEVLEQAMSTDEGTVDMFVSLSRDKVNAEKALQMKSDKVRKATADAIRESSYSEEAGKLEAKRDIQGNVDTRTATQIKDAQELVGASWVKRFKHTGMSGEQLEQFGVSQSQFGKMDPQSFQVESEIMNGFIEALVQGKATIKGQEFQIVDKGTTLDTLDNLQTQLEASGYLKEGSPFRDIFNHMRNSFSKSGGNKAMSFSDFSKKWRTMADTGSAGAQARARKKLSSAAAGD